MSWASDCGCELGRPSNSEIREVLREIIQVLGLEAEAVDVDALDDAAIRRVAYAIDEVTDVSSAMCEYEPGGGVVTVDPALIRDAEQAVDDVVRRTSWWRMRDARPDEIVSAVVDALQLGVR